MPYRVFTVPAGVLNEDTGWPEGHSDEIVEEADIEPVGSPRRLRDPLGPDAQDTVAATAPIVDGPGW